ncbi:hypothetical protein [Malaciobacter mytili]|uniref:Transcriptional regulator n=2 Tax=Malaciobacter mytili TaxID=603050 RepID=A0AAX2AJT3_9BACT|nr:hypothetical protein [Malaciobacter mytili]AXH14579.1 hypothetical protein AMYT_0990 [Malaciobacter mytili LMG 24559]RXI47497.1 hypothetical protein CRU99_02385 [Malaciobacter mytili]RXK16632.1 hypothetical protein CP985_02505 [Malaciobacter mytili LMG 24559]
MTLPSLRKLEKDLGVNKTTLHNWKKTRPKLYNFIIESYKHKELLRQNLQVMINQKNILEEEIKFTENKL